MWDSHYSHLSSDEEYYTADEEINDIDQRLSLIYPPMGTTDISESKTMECSRIILIVVLIVIKIVFAKSGGALIIMNLMTVEKRDTNVLDKNGHKV